MKNKLFIYFGIIILISISFSSAYETLGIFKKGENITLIQGCESSSYANISNVFYPNSTIASSNIAMIGSNNYYKYNFTKTQGIGTYKVVGYCDEAGIYTQWIYQFTITPNGTEITLGQTIIYSFFLLLIIGLLVYSFRITINNPAKNDKISVSQQYELSKSNKFLFYWSLIKKKMWIVGVFGIYLSTFLFFAIATELSYNLGLESFSSIFKEVFMIIAWCGIPFTIFWLVWLILYLAKGSEEMLKYVYGGFTRKDE